MGWTFRKGGTRDPRAALDAHRDAAREFHAAAEALAPEGWTAAPIPGKWSPAEITEHLSLSYDAHVGELVRGLVIPVKVKGLKRIILRLTVMPRLLRTGNFPPGVRAPRGVVPAGPGGDRPTVLRRFADCAAAFEAAMRAQLDAGRGRMTHPFFGGLTAWQGIRFVELHVRHHRRQLPAR